MLQALTTEGGCAVAWPDICLVQYVPVPFINRANARNGDGTSDRVLINNKPVLTLRSTIPCSTGAADGATGVLSGVANKACTFITASAKVIADGDGVVLVRSRTFQNNRNAIGVQIDAAQSKVLAAG